MFKFFKRKEKEVRELYPGVPTTDGTNDFLLLYSKQSKKELTIILTRFKQQVVEKALDLTLTNYSTYKYNILIEDIRHLSYCIKSIELLLRVAK